VLETVRVDNDPVAESLELAKAGPDPEVVLARLSWLARGGGVKPQVSSYEWTGLLYYPPQRLGA
jgi:hypothetical protein